MQRGWLRLCSRCAQSPEKIMSTRTHPCQWDMPESHAWLFPVDAQTIMYGCISSVPHGRSTWCTKLGRNAVFITYQSPSPLLTNSRCPRSLAGCKHIHIARVFFPSRVVTDLALSGGSTSSLPSLTETPQATQLIPAIQHVCSRPRESSASRWPCQRGRPESYP